MKCFKSVPKLSAFLLLLLNTSCIEKYKIATKVNADGSLERSIQVICDDEKNVFEGNLVVPNDSSWNIATRWIYEIPEDTGSEKHYEYTAKKKFTDVSELNIFLNPEKDTSFHTHIDVSLEKKFRWFYTYMRYSETYKKSLPFDFFKVEDYLTPEELSYFYDDDFMYVPEKDSLIHLKNLDKIPILNHGDSIRMEELQEMVNKKLNEFLGRNIYEELYAFLVEEFKRKEDERLRYLTENKELIYRKSNLNNAFSNLLNISGNSDSINIMNISLDSLENLNPKAFEIIENKFEILSTLLVEDIDYTNAIEMPGILLNTNADSINASLAYWNYNEFYFFLNDYQLISESRLINKWAFFVTALIAIFLLIVIFYRK